MGDGRTASDPGFLPVWATSSLNRLRAQQEGYEYDFPVDDYYTIRKQVERMHHNEQFDFERPEIVESPIPGNSLWSEGPGEENEEFLQPGRRALFMPELEEDEGSRAHVAQGQVPKGVTVFDIEEDEASMSKQRISSGTHSWILDEGDHEFAPGHEPRGGERWIRDLFQESVEEDPLAPTPEMPVQDNQITLLAPTPQTSQRSHGAGEVPDLGDLRGLSSDQLLRLFAGLQRKVDRACEEGQIVLHEGRGVSESQKEMILRKISLEEFELWSILYRKFERDGDLEVDAVLVDEELRSKHHPDTFTRMISGIMEPSAPADFTMTSSLESEHKLAYAMETLSLKEKLEVMRHTESKFREVHDAIAQSKALQDRVVYDGPRGKIWRSDLKDMTQGQRDWFMELRRRERIAQSKKTITFESAEEIDDAPHEFSRTFSEANMKHAAEVLNQRSSSHSYADKLLDPEAITRADSSAFVSAGASHMSEFSEHVVSVLHGASIRPTKTGMSRSFSSAASVMTDISASSKSSVARSKLGKDDNSMVPDMNALTKIAMEHTRVKTKIPALKQFQTRSKTIHFARESGHIKMDPLMDAQHTAKMTTLTERARYKDKKPDPRTGDVNRFRVAADQGSAPLLNTQQGFWHLNQFNNMAVVTRAQK